MSYSSRARPSFVSSLENDFERVNLCCRLPTTPKHDAANNRCHRRRFTPIMRRHFISSVSSSQQIGKHQDEQVISKSISDPWPTSISAALLNAQHWTYLAEGAKNLLLRYDGPNLYPLIGPSGGRLALRLRKIDHNRAKVEQEQENLIDAIEWSDTVLKPDLDSCCALPPLHRLQDDSADCKDTKAFVEQMAAKIESMRPIERRKKSGLDEALQHGISVTEDLSAGIEESQVICFEVKPKCGFLPSETAHLSPETMQLKRRFSRYRMHRVLKSRPMPSLADFDAFYDPLDLCSGQKVRVEKAASALYSDWLKGEGNLHIFVNGQRINGAEIKPVDDVTQKYFSNLSLESMLVDTLASKGVQDILERLVHLQARYDDLDVEGVASLYQTETGNSLLEAKEAHIRLAEYQQATKKGPTSSSRHAIVKLLLSTMYKDCSIFVRCISGQTPTMHIVDLDPKPVTKLPYLFQLDQDICRTFQDWSREVGLM